MPRLPRRSSVRSGSDLPQRNGRRQSFRMRGAQCWCASGAREAARLQARQARLLGRSMLRIEAMHVKGPLQADERALDAGQQPKGRHQRQRQPDGEVQPGRRGRPLLEGEDAPDDEMADDQDGKVGRRVVGAVVVEGLAARGTGVPGLEVAAEQGPLAALGSALDEAAQHGPRQVARRMAGGGLVFDHGSEISDGGAVRVAAFRPPRSPSRCTASADQGCRSTR